MSKLVVDKAKQWEALLSPVRLEVVETLELFGPGSIAEVAAELERTPHSLYHHFHKLVSVGIIQEVDSRRSGARTEAIYDVCGRPVIIDFDLSTPKARGHRVRAARQLLRQAQKDYESAIEVAQNGDVPKPEVRRYRVRLGEESVQKIRDHLDAIVEVVLTERLRASEKAPGSRWISWVSLLAPQEPGELD